MHLRMIIQTLRQMAMADDDDDPYESLPTHSLAVHLLAGAAAGLAEHCVMFPIDSVKVGD